MTDKEKDNRVNALAMTFLEELQMRPHPFADQILRAYKAGYHQSEKDSLHEEPKSENLNTAAKEYANNITEKIGYRLQLRRAVCFGAKLQKEQMMAKAIGVEVKVDAGGYPYIPQIELYDYDKDIPLAEVDDKYKVILIKED